MRKMLLPVTFVPWVVFLCFCDAVTSNDLSGSASNKADLLASFATSKSTSLSSSPSGNTDKCYDFSVPCSDGYDMVLFCKSIVLFLKKTSKGVPESNILAIDPYSLPSFEEVFDSEGVTYVNSNLKLTGLGDQTIYDIKVDTIAKSVTLITKADINMVSDVTVSFTKLSNVLNGHYNCYATVLTTIKFDYDLRTDNKGVVYLDISPKSTNVDVLNTPIVILNPELEAIVLNDSDVKEILTSKMKAELRVKTICNVVEKAYTSVIQNIRTATQVLPASAFLKTATLHD